MSISYSLILFENKIVISLEVVPSVNYFGYSKELAEYIDFS